MKILLLEDDPALGRIYSKYISKAGHDVDHKPDGWEGFVTGSTAEYDLVISDFMMPNWDGQVSMEGLLALNPELKFLFVSGVADSEKVAEIKKNPAVKGFLTKPVNYATLIGAIEEALAS